MRIQLIVLIFLMPIHSYAMMQGARSVLPRIVIAHRAEQHAKRFLQAQSSSHRDKIKKDLEDLQRAKECTVLVKDFTAGWWELSSMAQLGCVGCGSAFLAFSTLKYGIKYTPYAEMIEYMTLTTANWAGSIYAYGSALERLELQQKAIDDLRKQIDKK